jgi:hypothetical protein
MGVPVQTVNRIEHATVDPRFGTLDELLRLCDRTLNSQTRSLGERAAMSELLGLAPLARLVWGSETGWAARVVRLLQILVGHGVWLLIVGSSAERLHGSPVAVPDLEIRVGRDERNIRRLRRALQAGNKPLQRVGITVITCSPDRLRTLLISAWSITLPNGFGVQVMALEDLIASAPPDRVEILRQLREEIDARSI